MTTPARTGSSTTFGHIALALISLAAAGIHFAVTGDHFQEHLAFGLFFSVVAWAQALWAVGILVSTSRRLLLAGLAGNLIVILTWALSRTSGFPIGPAPWTAEEIGFADLLSTFLELVIVAGCGLLLAHRSGRIEPRRGDPVRVLAFGLSLAVLTSTAIAIGAGHSHSPSVASGHHASPEADHHGSGGEAHVSSVAPGEMDPAQIDLVRTAMAKYEDVDVALAEGWTKEHRDWPEVGSHFYRVGDWAGSFPARPELDPIDPEFLMYSRLLTGDWKLVAVAYVMDQAVYPEPPTELKGAVYHEHVWNCIAGGEELEEEDYGFISKSECRTRGGVWSPGGVWMTHVWFVDNPEGVFAETNPTLV